MTDNIFGRTDILIPKGADMKRWSVIACDQYTSEPSYWERAEEFVSGGPSTLRLTLPEIYLESESFEERINEINKRMLEYLSKDVFKEYPSSYIYVERELQGGTLRRGLVGAIDLLRYDYSAGSESEVRATEGTVLSRIPPRLKIRERAPLELTHVMVLCDDRERAVIEPLGEKKGDMRQVYDFELMLGGGYLRGYVANGEAARHLDEVIGRYEAGGGLIYAVGDGNHSLATARENFLRIRESIGEEAAMAHPARYALCELCNLWDESIQFEPIHRILFDVSSEEFLSFALSHGALRSAAHGMIPEENEVVYLTGDSSGRLCFEGAPLPVVGALQDLIDAFIEKSGGRCDYIHGENAVKQLTSKGKNIGFLLPAMDKDNLFGYIAANGALPRKTFSIGHADDKRFYLEARAIKTL